MKCVDSGTPPGPSCDSNQIWARVNVDSFSNQGAGNFTNNVYVGSSSNVVASGEWFLVHDGTNYISDPVITGYQNVTGLAVRRVGDGRIVLALQGTNPLNSDLEHVTGNIEFFNADVTNVYFDANQDPLETNPTLNTNLDSISFAADKSNFDLYVSTGNDRYVTGFVFAEDEDCDDGGNGGNTAPVIIVANACILTDATEFDFLAGVTTSDADGDTVTVTYVVNPDPIVFGENGSYTITYTATTEQRQLHLQ
ncbi:MAG: hypothetical protein R3B65_02565 [Candidatus Paceibacterota bacterium]